MKKNSSKSSRKLTFILLFIVVFLIVAIGLMVIPLMQNDESNIEVNVTESVIPTYNTTDSSEAVTEMTETDPIPTESITETSKPEESSSPSTEAQETQATTEPKPVATTPKVTEPVETEGYTVEETVNTDITLPYTIPGTNLVLKKIANYKGAFLEDGSDDKVSAVAMILLYNSGNEAIEYTSINVVFENTTLEFIASAIPAKGSVTVQETNRMRLPSETVVACTAEIAVREDLEMCDDQIRTIDNGDGSISVTNLTDVTIPTVRLFYKYYMSDNDVYVGGITYTAKISDLGPNATTVIEPSHFSSGSSKIVMIRTYDTDA